MDPRVKASAEDLRAQLDRSLEVAADMGRSLDALQQVKKDRARVGEGPRAQKLADLESTLSTLNGRLTSIYTTLQDVDAAPTPAALQAADDLRRELATALHTTPSRE